MPRAFGICSSMGCDTHPTRMVSGCSLVVVRLRQRLVSGFLYLPAGHGASELSEDAPLAFAWVGGAFCSLGVTTFGELPDAIHACP
jgi:hypothetical protein